MPRQKSTHCKRGHLFTTSSAFTRKNGRRECRLCKSIIGRLRYRNDAEFRIKRLIHNRDYREKQKQQEVSQ